LTTARRAGIQAAEIIKQIIDVSRQKNTPKIPVKMAFVVAASLKRYGALLPAGIKIKQVLSIDIDTVFANEAEIRQVLFHLCDNAVEAMEMAGGQITLGLTNVAIEKDAAFSPLHLLPGRYLKSPSGTRATERM
jgi:signal transduction histidine kinase